MSADNNVSEALLDTTPPCGQPSQFSQISNITDTSGEDYVAAGGTFYNRMKFWMGSFYRLYHVQMAIILSRSYYQPTEA